MTIKLGEYLSDGSVQDLAIKDSLIMLSAADPLAEGLFMRVGSGGIVTGYRAPNQDLEWVDSRTDLIDLGAAGIELARLTVDHDISTTSGSFSFYCKVDNTGNATESITFRFMDDGTEIASKTIDISRATSGYGAAFWGSVTTPIADGSVLSVIASSTATLQVRGDISPTTLKVIEAQAAPVSAIDHEKKPLIFSNTITSPSRSDIIDAMIAAGIDASIMDHDFIAHGYNNTYNWQILYNAVIDAFYILNIEYKG